MLLSLLITLRMFITYLTLIAILTPVLLTCHAGAWVTATDLSRVMDTLTENLTANTRGRCKYDPQTDVLCWGQDLARSFPTSIYRYDYILAADVVYSHGYTRELLATMCHFCQRGTTLIWAHQFQRYSDRSFKYQFKDALHTRKLMEAGDVKIYMATGRGRGPGWSTRHY